MTSLASRDPASRLEPAPGAVRAEPGVLDVDRAAALPFVLGATTPVDVRCLVRHAGVPVGCVDLTVPPTGLLPADLESLLQASLGPISAQDAVTPASAVADLSALSVVIATRDRTDALRRCLESVFAMRTLPQQVIVVDNAPSDGSTASMIERDFGADPFVVYVREDRPGLAYAHNAALPFVEAPLVAFTDDDVLVDRFWSERIVTAFGAADDVACVTGLIFPAELRTPAQWWIERSAGFAKGFSQRIIDPVVEARTNPLFPFAAGTFGSGANMAMTAAFLRSVHGFDPALGTGTTALGGDDLAAIYAVLAGGHRLVYEPAAVVFHHHHRSYESLRKQVYGYGAGLTAYLTSIVVGHPAAAVTMAGKAVGGLRHAFAPSSPRNNRRPAAFAELKWVERRGMLSGPWRYLRSHRSLGRPGSATATGVAR